jgi:hypothetical protein
MDFSIVPKRSRTSALVKRVSKLVRKTHFQHRPNSEQVVSVKVRIRQADAGFAYPDGLEQNQAQNHTKTIGQNLDCYI